MTRRRVSFAVLIAVLAAMAGVIALRPATEREHEHGPEVDSELAQLNAQAGSVQAAPAHRCRRACTGAPPVSARGWPRPSAPRRTVSRGSRTARARCATPTP